MGKDDGGEKGVVAAAVVMAAAAAMKNLSNHILSFVSPLLTEAVGFSQGGQGTYTPVRKVFTQHLLLSPLPPACLPACQPPASSLLQKEKKNVSDVSMSLSSANWHVSVLEWVSALTEWVMSEWG